MKDTGIIIRKWLYGAYIVAAGVFILWFTARGIRALEPELELFSLSDGGFVFMGEKYAYASALYLFENYAGFVLRFFGNLFTL